jgi:hypothetical protein
MLASMVMTTRTSTCVSASEAPSDTDQHAPRPLSHQYQRRMVSASRFAQLVSVVYREQLGDLSLLRLAEGSAPPRSRIAALDALTSATARSLRAVREREFAMRILSPRNIPGLFLAAAANEACKKDGDQLAHLLYVAPSGTASRRAASEPERTRSIIAELRCPWVHVPLRSVAAVPGLVPGPFAPLLERAGVPEAAKITAVSLSAPLQHRLERLQRVILGIEKANGLMQSTKEDKHQQPHRKCLQDIATHQVRSPYPVQPVTLLVHSDARLEWLLDAVASAPRTDSGAAESTASPAPVLLRSPASDASPSAVASPASPTSQDSDPSWQYAEERC